ncbi:MAG: diacylglycerol kinase, catalytic region [Haloplasmataceae bacterium]|jgi:YegS/Rv2252/BmrU family lipid kinase|nr:diacylglycerol kinase, catalytic region [Haloplasmataceae bacterium]
MKYLFALNPVSGKGKAKQNMKELTTLLDKSGIDYLIYETKPIHYAQELKEMILEYHITHIYAVGGDGTAHEVLNAIVDLDVYFGIIPFGTGNDFARLLNIPKKIDQVFEMIINNKYEFIDIGQANGVYFLNFVSFGIDVNIVENSLKYKKIFPSGTAYLFSLLTTLLTYKCKKIITNDKSQKVYLTTIHNGKFYGGGMKINPYAEINDGLLDMCIVKKISKLKLLFLFPSVFKGNHYKYDKIVNFKKCEQFYLEIEDNVMTGVDGEIYDLHSPININVIANKVKFIKY